MNEVEQQDKAAVGFSIRMPEDLHQWLSERAEKNYRSKVSELLFILEKIRSEDLAKGVGNERTVD